MAIPALFVASPDDLRTAYEGLKQRYLNLPHPRFWDTGLVLARLVRDGHLRQWAGYSRQIPSAAKVRRPAVEAVIEPMFTVPTDTVMRARPKGVLERFRQLNPDAGLPKHLVVDPLYAANVGKLCVMVSSQYAGSANRMLHVPFDDASWVWNDNGVDRDWSANNLLEMNRANNFNQQNGVSCAYPIPDLRAGHPHPSGDPLDVDRTNCEHWRDQHTQHPDRDTLGPWCSLNWEFCAAERAGRARSSGSPRALLATGDGEILAPGGLERIIDAATDGGAAPLPRRGDLAVVLAASRADKGRPGAFTALLDMLRAQDFERLTEAA